MPSERPAHTSPVQRMPMMHIAQVLCTSRRAGIGNDVAMVSHELRARGHQVTVVSQLDPRTFLEPGVHGVHVRNWRHATAWLRSNPHVDLIHSHTTLADVAAVRGSRGAPVVSTRHLGWPRWSNEDGQGRSWLRPRGWAGALVPDVALRWPRERINRGVAWEIAVSDFVASRMPRCDEVIHTGIPPRGDLTPVAERPKRVITLQRLEEVKRTELAIEAWALSTARLRGWSLELHGDGRLRSHLAQEVARRGLEDSVTLPGWCDQPAALLASAALLLAPAAYDAFPLTVLEAMASAVPVIAAAAGGHLETLSTVPNAALFPVGDAAACARHLDHLTSDAAAMEHLSRAQRDVQRTQFSVATMVDRLEATYARLVDGTPGMAANFIPTRADGRTP